MKHRLRLSLVRSGVLALLALALTSEVAFAQEAEVSQALFTVNNTWMLVASFLVCRRRRR